MPQQYKLIRMKKHSNLWKVIAFALLVCSGAQASVAAEGNIGSASITPAAELTGRGNRDEALLQLAIDVEASGSATWKNIRLVMNGTATLDDVTRIKIYSTGNSDVFDSRKAASYTKLGECTPRKGMFDCPLTGTISSARQYLWITCDVSAAAVEGHRIELGVQAIASSAESYRLKETQPEASCQIVLARKLLYAPGDLGSKNYRIPAIVTATDGSLVIATDMRKANQGDLPEDIDVLINRSVDGGKTWSAPITIAKGTGRFAGYGDAALVCTGEEGGLLCVFVGGNGFFESTSEFTNRTYVCKSMDNGQTWTAPKDITDQLFGPGCPDPVRSKWQGSFCTSGAGLLGSDGTIYIVAAVRETAKRTIHDIANYVYYSEDKGETWKVSSCVMPIDANEAKIVELSDGTLLVSIRNQARGARYFSTSNDKGRTWSQLGQWQEMIEPGCNGDMIYYPSAKEGGSKNLILHTVPNHPSKRENVSIFLSYDEGKTWPVKKTICRGGSAYSALCILQDGTIGIYTEENRDTGDFSMYFTNISLRWLSE